MADPAIPCRRALGCENNRDAVLFTGTGSTGAIGKMLDLLRGTPDWQASFAAGTPPLVVIGPYEHHSNILPWRESGCQVVMVQEAEAGGVDMGHLEQVLREHAETPVKIGSFSAASNLTGILCDTVALSVALHRHKALAFFDYATAGPYASIDMNPVVTATSAEAALGYKDAVFLSPHKFVGGVSTPGVLAFKKHILDNTVAFGLGAPPALPGGGSVFFVTEQDHRYLGNLEEREEAGTPDIVGSIRCGLAMRVKESVGVAAIAERERHYCRLAFETWGRHPAIHILGNMKAERLPVLAFNIRHGARYLHHNYVAALLNDLFGLQVRAGCSCAGPYAQRLLGIDLGLAKEYEAALLQGDEVLRPGLVRLNLNYFLPQEVVEFVLRAVAFVAEFGWKLLPLYTFIPATGEWRHRCDRRFVPRPADLPLCHVCGHPGPCDASVRSLYLRPCDGNRRLTAMAAGMHGCMHARVCMRACIQACAYTHGWMYSSVTAGWRCAIAAGSAMCRFLVRGSRGRQGAGTRVPSGSGGRIAWLWIRSVGS